MAHFPFEVKPEKAQEFTPSSVKEEHGRSVSEEQICFTCGKDILPAAFRPQVVYLMPISQHARFGAVTGSLQTSQEQLLGMQTLPARESQAQLRAVHGMPSRQGTTQLLAVQRMPARQAEEELSHGPKQGNKRTARHQARCSTVWHLWLLQSRLGRGDLGFGTEEIWRLVISLWVQRRSG